MKRKCHLENHKFRVRFCLILFILIYILFVCAAYFLRHLRLKWRNHLNQLKFEHNTINNRKFLVFVQILAHKRSNRLGIGFDELNEALISLGLSSETLEIVYRRISGILHLGNIKFDENSHGVAKISEPGESLDISAQLLDIDCSDLEMAFLNKKVTVGKSHIE